MGISDLTNFRSWPRYVAILIAFWGLVAGIKNFVESVIISLIVIHRESPSETQKIYDVFGAFQLMMFEYSMVLIIIFSFYLLYGAIWDSPRRSSCVCSWLLYAGLSDLFVLYDLVVTVIRLPSSQRSSYSQDAAVIGSQFICLFIIYLYYRTLPRK